MKRDITLVDQSAAEVKVTFWGDRARSNPEQWDGFPVIALRGCKVSDFGGRSIGTYNSTKVRINPDIPEGHSLRGWYDDPNRDNAPMKKMSTGGGGGNRAMHPFAQRTSLEEIRTKGLGQNDKPDWITVKATITFIKHDQDEKGDLPGGPWYHACPADSGNNYKVGQCADAWSNLVSTVLIAFSPACCCRFCKNLMVTGAVRESIRFSKARHLLYVHCGRHRIRPGP